MEDTNPNPDQEEFAEESLGEAQSENPPADPEMLEDEGSSEGGAETYGGDPDEGATATDLDDPENADRDQAEG